MYQIPTLQEIIDRIEADFKSRIEGAASFLRRSIIKVFSRVYGGAIYLVYGYLKDQEKQIFITTADDEKLLIHGNEYGVPIKNAQRATGTGSGTGTTGTLIAAGKELKSATGVFYVVSEAAVVEAGTFTVDVYAKEPGNAGNDDAGTILSFVSPIPGVSTKITIDSDGLSGGLEQESADEYRIRILTRKRNPPHAGTVLDYENWALEYPGVINAWAFGNYFGPGTVGLAYILEDNELPDAEHRSLVYDYIVSHTDTITGKTIGKPVTAGLVMIDMSYYSLDYTVKLNPNNSVVRSNVTSTINTLINEIGGPGETIYLSKVAEAISASAGEISNTITFPTGDVAIPTNRYPVLGTITFEDYQ